VDLKVLMTFKGEGYIRWWDVDVVSGELGRSYRVGWLQFVLLWITMVNQILREGPRRAN